MSAAGRVQFVLFGSSIVQMSYNVGGWGAILADLYDRKADILLRGYSGWNSRMALQVLDQVFPKDAIVQPSLVVVYFGGNDSMQPHPSGLGSHVPLPEYIENMKKIGMHLKNLSEKTRVIFLTSPPVNESMILETYGYLNLKFNFDLSFSSKTIISFLFSPPLKTRNKYDNQARTNESCRIYAEALENLCHQLEFKVINLWNAFQQREDWATACFTDGFHLSSEGSRIVVKEILKVLKEAEWEPSLYWMSIPTEFSKDSPYYAVAPDGKTTMNVSEFLSIWQKEWANI
ncbi:GDSL esterase/lipase CPRD49 [Abeliophyllum distichum]|uniref:GDSL esterase/lipase CPRD49 n=1 Tax=Abeliophyllum distichum TaxID=126358 RepID=A0ABD1QU96_9LAMI